MGGIVGKIVIGVIGLVIAGSVIVGLWPDAQSNNAAVAALTQTDISTNILQAVWPYTLVVLIAAVVIGIMVRQFKR